MGKVPKSVRSSPIAAVKCKANAGKTGKANRTKLGTARRPVPARLPGRIFEAQGAARHHHIWVEQQYWHDNSITRQNV
jgi:hypothetical protein